MIIIIVMMPLNTAKALKMLNRLMCTASFNMSKTANRQIGRQTTR